LITLINWFLFVPAGPTLISNVEIVITASSLRLYGTNFTAILSIHFGFKFEANQGNFDIVAMGDDWVDLVPNGKLTAGTLMGRLTPYMAVERPMVEIGRISARSSLPTTTTLVFLFPLLNTLFLCLV
jgi:hypothetical protein